MSIIELDGSYGEGGGQIVRTALALSTVTGKSFIVKNIRKGRPKPGLKRQHCHCIKALEQLCDAKAEGNTVGSDWLSYQPGRIRGAMEKSVFIDIGTAGSVTLLLQSVLLPCFFAEREVTLIIRGGTDTKWAMPFDYFKQVFVPHIKQYCKKIEVELIRRGYYPKGMGEVLVRVVPKPTKNKPLLIVEKKPVKEIIGVSHASLSLKKARVAERQAEAAERLLSRWETRIRAEYYGTACPGSGIVLWSNTLVGSDALGEPGKRAEAVGREAAERLLEELRAPVDSHLADNLTAWLALFKGSIRTAKITKHTLSSIYVAESFLGKCFRIKGCIISCE